MSWEKQLFKDSPLSIAQGEVSGHSFEVSGTGGQYDYTFSVPLRIPEKTDIDVRATVRSNNARITAAFDIILVEDGYEHI